jgi:hypothetical protein
MTLQEAKTLSLEVWKYLMEHPEIEFKYDLPKRLYKKIENMLNECPLCNSNMIVCCSSFEAKLKLNNVLCCPLIDCKDHKDWLYAKDRNERKLAAQKIVDAIKAWEPEVLGEKRQINKTKEVSE